MNSLSAESSVIDLLQIIRSQWPSTPFLALGQTALWDEPTKAVWRRLLDRYHPEATMIAGVHDTDYFAKTTAHLSDDRPYAMVSHDDGATRGLWSAAGELSCLFGSESVPTRQMYLRRSVPFDWLAGKESPERTRFFEEMTTAWGWRGIVSTEAGHAVARDVPLKKIAPALRDQLAWGFAESLAQLPPGSGQDAAAQAAAEIRGWVEDFIADCTDDCLLSDLYQYLLPRLYEQLLGHPAQRLLVTSSAELFRFEPSTADSPRFSLLNLFLNLKTRDACVRAYNSAVGGSGSGIYSLSEFGDGALPFDLLIPGRGRGTLRITSSGLFIDTTPSETSLPGRTATDARQLAELLYEEFGPGCILVGKAVTLIDMLAADYFVVFHESASGYTHLTRAFNQKLASSGMTLDLHPLVRLAYESWDSLEYASPHISFLLPPHLASAFGVKRISARAFSREWRGAVARAQALLEEAQGPRNLRSLLQFLEGRRQPDECWCDRLEEYEAQQQLLAGIARESGVQGARIAQLRQEIRAAIQERETLERRMGERWRAEMLPLLGSSLPVADWDQRLADRQRTFQEPLDRLREQIGVMRREIKELQQSRRALERSAEPLAARARVQAIRREAETARARLIRDAFLAEEGLQHANLRPTAWWIAMVSPDGGWLQRMAETATARWEELG